MDHGLPGATGPGADVIQLQFVGMMVGVVRKELESWGAAVRGQQPRALAEHYSDNASVVPPGAAFLKGSEALLTFSDVVTGHANDANASILDIEVSDGIAYVCGAFYFQPSRAGEPVVAGQHVTVMRRTGEDWRIRTQLFHGKADDRPFPITPAADQPAMLELGTTDSGQVPRDAFIGAVTAIAGLRRSWQENDVRAVRRFFTNEALLLLPDDNAPSRGVALDDAIRAAMTTSTRFETVELDFTSSGRLAVLVGEVVLESRNGQRHSGHYIAVFAKDGRAWRIRSLVVS
jgi:ketosteroid isomerase-like protein